MKRWLDVWKTAPHSRRFEIATGGLLALVGFILSPVSWWNDLFVNIPLAFGFAALVSFLVALVAPVPLWLFTSLFVLGYWLTNLLGFVLLHYGAKKVFLSESSSWRSHMLSGVYTIAIVVLIYFSDADFLSSLPLVPSWVAK